MLLNILSLISGAIGAIILAFSLSTLHKTYNGAFKIIELYLNYLSEFINNKDIGFVPKSLDEFIKNNKKGSDVWTIVGVCFIIVGLILGLASLLFC